MAVIRAVAFIVDTEMLARSSGGGVDDDCLIFDCLIISVSRRVEYATSCTDL